ncbi:MAG: hypothetical protein EOM26_08465 [Alphaproteobacteria bacterium]|nr:hypothetical protein [Alphaproteobacteria bacterium]
MPRNNPATAGERGNVFLMVLIGIVLFSALMFTFSRGMNESPTNISERQAKLTSSDILSYAQQIERGVARLLRQGCSQDDISFYSPQWGTPADYDNANNTFAAADAASDFSCFVFYPDGGRVSFKRSPEGVNATVFSAANTIGGAGDDTADETGTDLVVIYDVDSQVCTAVNNALGIASTAEEPGTLSLTPFTGSFAYSDTVTGAPDKAAACVSDTEKGSSFVYSVLYSR